jgi:hypothetical protein
LAQCKIELDASRTFRRNLESLEKKYRHIREDLEDAIAAIEADHEQNAFFPVALRGFNRRVWKYSFGSRDLRKHPRESFRMICTFLDDMPGVLYPVLCFWKGSKEDASAQEVKDAVDALVQALREPDDED